MTAMKILVIVKLVVMMVMVILIAVVVVAVEAILDFPVVMTMEKRLTKKSGNDNNDDNDYGEVDAITKMLSFCY